MPMSFTSKILSLNVGGPEQMHWQGKHVVSSMLKRPIPGPLVVHLKSVEGNSFANPQFHGAVDSVLYAYGLSSARKFALLLGLEDYEPGSTGETLTLDSFEESEVSVGDIFEVGGVTIQATFPRLPCGKVNYRMQHPLGQRAMIECGRSGVYFRILKPGFIHQTDLVKRIERSAHPFAIDRLYKLIMANQQPTHAELEIAKRNPAFPERQINKWEHERD